MQFYVLRNIETGRYLNFQTGNDALVWSYATIFPNISELIKFVNVNANSGAADHAKLQVCVVNARLTDRTFPIDGIDGRNELMYDELTINN